MAIHPTHAQTTPQHQIHAQQQQPQQCQQQQQLSSTNKPGNYQLYPIYTITSIKIVQRIKRGVSRFSSWINEKLAYIHELCRDDLKIKETGCTHRIISGCDCESEQ